MKIILLSLVILLSQVHCEDDGDWVDPFQLPIGFLTHPYYAGYLNISSTQAYYYNYFPSEGNPLKDPLIIRISAGPGCSGLYSAYYSKGPFIFVRGSKNFRVNPFNWNKNANLLIIQGPGEVGFSKGADRPYNDNEAAMFYYMAIQKFYQKFPQLKDQSMYLSGQQYAGIIVPRIAQTIIFLNRDPNVPAWLKIKFGGFLLNNPCTEGDECETHKEFSKYTIEYLKNHYFISDEVWDQYRTKCLTHTPQCIALIQSIESGFLNTGSDLRNVYNQCIQQQGDMPCFDQVGITWFLNEEKVKQEIHAETNITWKMCNFDVQNKWVRNPAGSIKIYEQLLRQQHDLKIWIVSGVFSGTVPTLGTKRWFEEIKKTVGLPATRLWEPWYYNHTVNAGDIEQIRGMSLITVRSAGYNLWNDQPQLGYHILDSFLKGIPL